MPRSTFFSAVAACAAALCLGPLPALAQCAMCKSSAAAGTVGRGLSISVLFMLGMLGAVIAWFVLVVIRSANRHATVSPIEAGGRAEEVREDRGVAAIRPAPPADPRLRPT